MGKSLAGLGLVFSLLLPSHSAVSSEAALSEELPVFQQAQDLNYGHVLYEYHQGNFFEALSALNVSKLKQGIKGHGDHPLLVEGGLMLAYGMIEDAKQTFEALLKEQISPSDKNQAWYYLGKVFYLMERDEQSLESFLNVELDRLLEEEQDLLYELLYMKGQIYSRGKHSARLAEQISLLPRTSIWRHYLQYNTVVDLLTKLDDKVDPTKSLTQAILSLKALIGDLDASIKESTSDELQSLREQCQLSLAQIYLRQGNDQAAFEALKSIRKDSALSDQALFAYSVAATNLGMHGYALEALNTLRERALFTPWLQQVPYALAYLYEQMSEPRLALQAYRIAVQHYEGLADSIAKKQNGLDEQLIVSALQLSTPIGDHALENDAYGLLPVQPEDFNFAFLLSSEAFQRQLSELHELYKLQNSLSRWSSQLDSFDTMMEIRIALRADKIGDTNQALEKQNVNLWAARQQRINELVESASAAEDIHFFMDEQQMKYAAKLESAYANFAQLPEDHRRKASLEKRLARSKAYFEWWVSDSYSSNKWRAVKEVRALNKQMALFDQHQSKLYLEMASDEENSLFAERIAAGRERLESLQLALENSLSIVRVKLLALVQEEFKLQMAETGEYLLAARAAEARLADDLHRAKNDPDISETDRVEQEQDSTQDKAATLGEEAR